MGHLSNSRVVMSRANKFKLPRFKYFPDSDKLMILIDLEFVEKRGLYIDKPGLMPYYVPCCDRLGRIGVWLYEPNDKNKYLP